MFLFLFQWCISPAWENAAQVTVLQNIYINLHDVITALARTVDIGNILSALLYLTSHDTISCRKRSQTYVSNADLFARLETNLRIRKEARISQRFCECRKKFSYIRINMLIPFSYFHFVVLDSNNLFRKFINNSCIFIYMNREYFIKSWHNSDVWLYNMSSYFFKKTTSGREGEKWLWICIRIFYNFRTTQESLCDFFVD